MNARRDEPFHEYWIMNSNFRFRIDTLSRLRRGRVLFGMHSAWIGSNRIISRNVIVQGWWRQRCWRLEDQTIIIIYQLKLKPGFWRFYDRWLLLFSIDYAICFMLRIPLNVLGRTRHRAQWKHEQNEENAECWWENWNIIKIYSVSHRR